MSGEFQVIRPTDGLEGGKAEPVVLAPDSSGAPSALEVYCLGEDLAVAVNVALALDQPLLVTGEPGCGKTMLAWAVARQLGAEVHEFHTKSNSVARDLFYTIDTVRRFHDATVGADEARDPGRYVTYQALGKAIQSERTTVVLIDEIDKAPRDFPNDLLNELDRMEFTVHELSPPRTYRQRARHFVLITSNSERRLPAPFLRRCAYKHIEFPDEAMLRQIVELHTAGTSIAASFVELAVHRFLELREIEGLKKAPATGELIAWIKVMDRMGIDADRLAAASLGGMPGREALLKLQEDLALVDGRR